MLIIVKQFRQLDREMLMALYKESNRKYAALLFPLEETEQGLSKFENAFEDYLRYDFFSAPGAFYALWEEDGRYLSAARFEPFEDGVLMEALETHPDYRCRGYAKKLIASVQENYADIGKIYSHVEKKNLPSLKTHLSCSFTTALDYARYIDGTVTFDSWTLVFSGFLQP